MAKARPNPRICVLVGRQDWNQPLPGRECLDRIHSHMTFEKADAMVDDGMAEWMTVEKVKRNGDVLHPRANAIRLLPRRSWKAKVSDRGHKPMKVMQLVA